jgi:hypothetical protein
MIAERAVALRGRKTDRADTEIDESESSIVSAYVRPETPRAPTPVPIAHDPVEVERIGRAITPVSGVVAQAGPVSDELDERFAAVTATPVPGVPMPLQTSPSGRIPLILTPRASSDPGRVTPMEAAVMQVISETTPPPVQMRPPTAPEIETVEDPEMAIPVPGPRIRLDSEPAEIVIEMEADEAPDPAGGDTSEPIVRVTENTEGKVTETIHDTSSQTLTVTVTESASDDSPRRPPTEPVTSESTSTTAGSISVSGRPGTNGKR